METTVLYPTSWNGSGLKDTLRQKSGYPGRSGSNGEFDSLRLVFLCAGSGATGLNLKNANPQWCNPLRLGSK